MPIYLPPEEAQHLADLRSEDKQHRLDFNVEAAIDNALEDEKKSSSELAEQAIAYAQRLQSATSQPETVLISCESLIASAAMIVARDGTDQLIDEQGDWVRNAVNGVFKATAPEVVRELRNGIRHNPIAIATLGLIYLWHRRGGESERNVLLELAGRDTAEAAHGFAAGLDVIRRTDPRLIPSVLRCALTAQIKTVRRWDDPDEKKAADRKRHRENVAAAIAAEHAWLRGETDEPAWPVFPPCSISLKRGIRIGGDEGHDQPVTGPDRVSEELLTQRAELWVRQMSFSSDPQSVDWLRNFVSAYADWTAKANGAGLEQHAEIDSRLEEWNRTFFRLMVQTLVRLTRDDAVAEMASVIAVPDKSFFDIATEIVHALDELYFNNQGLDLDTALELRGLVANRLTASAGWRRECNRSELSVEMEIGPAIAVLFFNSHNSINGAHCHLRANGIERVDAFLPQLTRLIEVGSVPFTALLTMNLLEVSPKPEHMNFFLSSALTWLRRQPDNTRLWVDSGLGVRLAKWLKSATMSDVSLRSSAHPLRPQIDDVLARLVRTGVAEARSIEHELE